MSYGYRQVGTTEISGGSPEDPLLVGSDWSIVTIVMGVEASLFLHPELVKRIILRDILD